MSKPTYTLGRQSKSRRGMIIAAIIIALLLVLGGGGYLYHKNQQQKASQEQRRRDEAGVESNKKKAAQKRGKKPSSNTQSDGNNTPSNDIKLDVPASYVKITIQNISQSGGYVNATASAASQSGDCVFTYSAEGDKPVVRSAKLEGGSCKSSVPEVEFTKLGSWNLNVTLYTNGSKSEANQSVTIN